VPVRSAFNTTETTARFGFAYDALETGRLSQVHIELYSVPVWAGVIMLGVDRGDSTFHTSGDSPLALPVSECLRW